MSAPVFLTAEWRSLVMWNVPVDPALLKPHVPDATELDLWNGEALVSVVGFRFLDTRIKGWAIPGHRNFSEINLRFYVRRKAEEGWRRGVVFLKEIVDRPAVAWVANTLYHENYVTRRLRTTHEPPGPENTGQFAYGFREPSGWVDLAAEVMGEPRGFIPGEEAEFIAEHYWGYVQRPGGGTLEYAVEHPAWRVWPTATCTFTGDPTRTYGSEFAAALCEPPRSSFVAEGSAILVRGGRLVDR